MAEEQMFKIKNMRRVVSLIRKMSPDVKREVEKASNKIAVRFVSDVRASARTPREHLMVSSATVRKHLIPKVAFGGSTLMATSEPVTAGRLFYGTEFGGRQALGRWWSPWRGKGAGSGYVIYPTLRAQGSTYANEWHKGVEKALDRAAGASRGV